MLYEVITVVTGPAAPPLSTLDDLSGNEVWVRRSSSYYESLTALNPTLTAKGLPPIKIREANENLEGEDILEMVSAGLLPMTVLDDYRAAVITSYSIHYTKLYEGEGGVEFLDLVDGLLALVAFELVHVGQVVGEAEVVEVLLGLLAVDAGGKAPELDGIVSHFHFLLMSAKGPFRCGIVPPPGAVSMD